jgi:hypothetical protein
MPVAQSRITSLTLTLLAGIVSPASQQAGAEKGRKGD